MLEYYESAVKYDLRWQRDTVDSVSSVLAVRG